MKTLSGWKQHFKMETLTDAEATERIVSAGLEIANPQSMADEWANRMIGENGSDATLNVMGFCPWLIGDAPKKCVVRDVSAWLTAFETAVREDERGKWLELSRSEQDRITRHITALRASASSVNQRDVLDQLQARIDEDK